jgi:hypothetical protein
MRQTAAVLSTLFLLASCADAPQPTSPTAALQPVVSGTLSLVDLLAARGPSPARPRGTTTVAFAMVPDPLDPNTITYTFDDVPPSCFFDAVLANPHEDLTFTVTPLYAACFSPNGTMAIIPADLARYLAGDVPQETRIVLPFNASTASIEFYDFWTQNVVLNAYDASGTLLASGNATAFATWTTVSVSATGIAQIGLVTRQANTYFDNLKITYKKDPTNKDQCKDGGWESYGFKNQGQCVRFVETGKDSRAS